MVNLKDSEVETYDSSGSSRQSYDAHWDNEHFNRLLNLGPTHSFEHDLQSVAPDSRVLFLGLGSGSNAAKLAKSAPDAEVFGVELSSKRARIAHENHSRNVYVLRSDAEYLPFDDGSFDVVVAHAVLHHLPDWRGRGLNEIVRVLDADGSFVFYEPGRYNPPAALRRRFVPSAIHTPGEEPFDPRELNAELSKRFSSVEMTGHCLLSHTLPVFDNYLPFSVPFGATRRLYAAERKLFERTEPLLAWILTGRADL